jgi:poly-gamma-glutamate synthesis protein (capsule biosynthesis protein)
MALKEFVFKADPKSAESLKAAGFDALMLANNHTMDYLSAGLSDTIKALSGAGIYYAGAGQSKGEIRPCFIEKNGVRIGVLSYNTFLLDEALPPDGGATIAYVSAEFLDDMRKEITQAAAECDFLIVYFHWGIEYANDVSDEQKEIAHAAVDSGASLIVGTHPHVLQGREAYKGVPIYYSLGNFVFDRQEDEGTDEAVILQLTIGKKEIIKEDVLPVVIEEARPRLAEDERAAKILADMKAYSSRFEKGIF